MIGLGLISLISTITASDVRNVLATDAACSRQHLTTCVSVLRQKVNEKLKQASKRVLTTGKSVRLVSPLVTLVGSIMPAAIRSSY